MARTFKRGMETAEATTRSSSIVGPLTAPKAQWSIRGVVLAIVSAGAVATLSACVAAPPDGFAHARPDAPMNPREAAIHRMGQVDARLQEMHRRIAHNVEMGYYSATVGEQFSHRLSDVSRESHDMTRQHGGGLSREDQSIVNRQLDDLGQEIR